MFTNTAEFSYEARQFKKQGFYSPDPYGSIGWFNYWKEQQRRCLEGYQIGDTRITGDHYAYLNFGQILLTDKTNAHENVTKKKSRTGKKVVSFPDFWDGDYDYFWALDIAENGISEQAYHDLNMEINIHPDYLGGGHHIIVSKARRKGFSFKNAFRAANRYNHIRNSNSIIGAYDSSYLYPEGTMSMVSDYINFFNTHTGWGKRMLINTKPHKKSGYTEYIDGKQVEKGYKSQVIAVTFQNNADAARGKNASQIFFEEGGAFDNLKSAYAATRPTVEDGAIVTGIIIIFGTGGDMERGTVDFESMFYNPEPYNLIPIENIWDDGADGSHCGFFFPDYKNKIGYIDDDGNSDKEGAYEYENNIRLKIKNTATDPSTIDKHVIEQPFTPAEAFMQTGSNVFPVSELNQWKNYLQTSKVFKNLGIPGEIVHDNEKLVFKPNDSLNPLWDYPDDRNEDLSGCIVQYQAPFKENSGKTPADLYIIVHDPYAHDTNTNQGSLGAAYVIKRINPYSRPDDLIVASYVGKPGKQDDYNENLFKLAEYYNAKIGFENDRGDVVSFSKRKHKTHFLMEELEIIKPKENVAFRKLGRSFGMSMGSGERKAQGDLYLRDWLLRERGKDENGKTIYNLHKIYDLALVKELIKYNPKGNFDRVSAMKVGMYFLQDMFDREVQSAQTEEKDSFWERDLFS